MQGVDARRVAVSSTDWLGDGAAAGLTSNIRFRKAVFVDQLAMDVE
jgi:hypothetical protein